MEPITLPSNILQSGIFSVLDNTSLLALSGADAATFLHSQLTNDVTHLPPDSWRLGGYCTPKGRLLATLRYWTDSAAPDTIYLQLPSSIADSTRKRLQMFIMRAKVVFSALNDSMAAIGLYGQAATSVLQQYFGTTLPEPGNILHSQQGTLLGLNQVAGEAAWLWITPSAQIDTIAAALGTRLTAVSPAQWEAVEIASGIPVISLPTQEKFVPQMINYELVGGVSFKKGCYPGQEIVARSQYLGTIKRRAILARLSLSSDADPASASAGTELYSPDDPAQPCGTVVNIAPLATAGDWLCLAEVKLAALEGAGVHLGSVSGPRLHRIDLPYSITASVTD